MAQAQARSTALTTQYATQVSADLEHNTREQERIREELVALQQQLQNLREDQTVLIAIRRTLTGEIPAPRTEQPPTQVPTPIRETTEADPVEEATTTPVIRPKRTTAPAAAVTRGAEPARGTEQPTLGMLVRGHFAEGPAEPRSVAEITEALVAAHPDRGIKATVVRNTIEGLVAKGHVQRLKQGASVFYTLPAPAVVEQTDDTEHTAPVEQHVDTAPHGDDRDDETTTSAQ